MFATISLPPPYINLCQRETSRPSVRQKALQIRQHESLKLQQQIHQQAASVLLSSTSLPTSLSSTLPFTTSTITPVKSILRKTQSVPTADCHFPHEFCESQRRHSVDSGLATTDKHVKFNDNVDTWETYETYKSYFSEYDRRSCLRKGAHFTSTQIEQIKREVQDLRKELFPDGNWFNDKDALLNNRHEAYDFEITIISDESDTDDDFPFD